MKKQSKKTLALLLATLLVVGLFPTAGFAAVEGEKPASPSSIETPEATPLPEKETPAASETPATNSSLDGLLGEELYNFLHELSLQDEDALDDALRVLSPEQLISLSGVASDEELKEWLEIAKSKDVAAPNLPIRDGNGSLIHVGPVFGSSKELVPAVGQQGASKRSMFSGRSRTPPYTNPGAISYLNGSLTMSKVLSTTATTDMFSITLSASTLSQTQWSTKPADIVLVLDRSNSMKDPCEYKSITFSELDKDNRTVNTYSNEDVPRFYIMISGTLEPLYYRTQGQNANKWYYWNSGNDRVYISSTTTGLYRMDTRLESMKSASQRFIGTIAGLSPQSKIAIVAFAGSNATATVASLTALTSQGNIDNLKTSVQNLNVYGSTRHDLALQEAESIMSRLTDAQRGKVVILLTDGQPYSDNSNLSNGNVGQLAITAADNMKTQAVPTTIYTIGSFDFDDTTELAWQSSSYTVAQYMTRLATTSTAGKGPYYLKVNDGFDMETIFESIANEVGKTFDATFRDYISPYFDLVTATGVNVNVGDTYTANGVSGIVKLDAVKGIYVEWEHELKPSAPFSTTIYVKAKDIFLGGNKVPTNLSDSGLYAENTLYAFPQPSADVTLKLPFTANDKSIYIGDTVAQTDLYTPYDTSGIWDNYVDIAYAFDPTFTTQPTENKSYNVTATLTPKYTGAYSEGAFSEAGTTDATVYVFKPVITATDYGMYLGNTSSVNSGHVTKTGWTCGQTDIALPTGAEPGISYGYSATSPVNGTYNTGTGVFTPNVGGKQAFGITATVNGVTITPMPLTLNVYVYTPKITCSDSKIFLGETTDLYDNLTLSSWACPVTAPSGLLMDTPAQPSLAYTLSNAGSISPTATVDLYNVMTPSVGGDHDYNVATLELTGNAGQTTINNVAPYITAAVGSSNHYFTVTVVSGQVTITKSGGAAGESYIFTVTSDTGITVKEVIQGDGSKIIKGLPKGTYTVTEETAWSWRYDAAPTITWTAGDSTLGDTLQDTAIACSVDNTNRVPFWLSGESFAVNKFNPYSPAA